MSVKPNYSVRTAAPAEVEPELIRIWTDNLPVGDAAQRKYDWIYRQAPIAPDSVFMLHDGDRAVGTAGIGVRRFQVGRTLTDAALLVDLAVDADHRSLSPALRLVRAVREHVLGTMGLAYGFPNKLAIGVFKRARYKTLGAFARYARVLRHEPYLDRIAELPRVPAAFGKVLRLPLAPALIGRAIDVGRVVLDGPKIVGAVARYRLHTTDAADDRIDHIWDQGRGDYQVVAERSVGFARWRFAGGAYAFHYLCDRDRSAQPRAYAVTSVLESELVIWDMFGKVEHLGPLLDALMPSAATSGARTMTLRFLGDPRVVSVLTQRGFREVEAERSVLYDAGAGLGDPTLLDDVSGWFLLDVDEDE